MAFLSPENLASTPAVPAAVQKVARAARDLLGEEVTVTHDLGADSPLVVIHPAHGVLLLNVLSGGSRGLTRKTLLGATKPSQDYDALLAQSTTTTAELLRGLQRSPHLNRQVPVVGAVAAPDADRSTARAAKLDPDSMLLAEDLRSPEALPAAVRRLFGNRQTALIASEENAVRAVISPEIVIRDRMADGPAEGQIAFRAPTTDGESALAVLDREQQRLAMHLGAGYRVIRGVAGSGKSVVLTFRAKHLAERFPQWRILLTCYNKVLSRALAHELSSLPNIDVRTLDSFAWEAAGKPRASGKPTDEYWVQLRETALRNLRRNGGSYDVVLVDEGQDFDNLHFDVAYAALRTHREEPQFLVVLDAAQNIYRKAGRWNPPGMTARGRTTLLRRNYRNTKEILELAYGMLRQGAEASDEDAILDDPSVVVPPEATSRRGPKPLVTQARDADAEVQDVVQQLEKWRAEGVPWDDMLVIYGSREHQRRLYSECTRRHIPYFWVARSSKTKGQVMKQTDCVRSSTVQSIKGLEFGHVAICGVNQLSTMDDGGDDDDIARRRLLYVAMTRATDNLFVTLSGNYPLGADLLAAASS